MTEDELNQRNKEIREFENKLLDEKETILFAVEESNGKFVVLTSKNPRVMVSRDTKFEAIFVAFQLYLKRLAEIEGVQLTTADSEVSAITNNETTSN